jgi:hypothetical protein
MAEDHATAEGIDYRRESGIVRAQVDPNPDTAEHDLLSIIADLEGVDIEALPSLYTEADHFVEMLFKTPPSDGAQMEIAFSYVGYRITISKKGQVRLVDVKASSVEFDE